MKGGVGQLGWGGTVGVGWDSWGGVGWDSWGGVGQLGWGGTDGGKREISGLSSPFNLFSKQWYFPLTCHQSSKCYPSLGSIEFRNVSSNGATVICVRLQSSKSVVHIWCFKFTVHSFEHSRNNVSLNCSFLLIVIKCHYRFMKKIQKKLIFNQCL